MLKMLLNVSYNYIIKIVQFPECGHTDLRKYLCFHKPHVHHLGFNNL